ncbi:MAG TPA: cytochrome c peroxidase [Blastocatellia bacterium]|nr:cytochrome c peroxidase [Blastocatellia bacterium]
MLVDGYPQTNCKNKTRTPFLFGLHARRVMQLGLVLLAALLLFSCGDEPKDAPLDRPLGVPLTIAAPLGLPPVPIPADNPPTAEAIALGRRLYYERRLSSDNTLACGNCHSPYIGFADGLRFAGGVGGKEGARNTPTLLNAAYYLTQFWDGRAASLEQQAGMPIANPIEMNLPHDVCVTKLNADQSYQEAFAKVFGPGPITMNKLQKAIASFERTLLSGNSPFDRYQFGGDQKALSEAAIRGLAIFTDKQRGNCSTCHTIGDKFALFTDNLFHNIGVGLDPNGELKDLGRYEQSKNEAERGAFRTPSLRHVAKTAPYMHDGSLKTLQEVVDFYVGGGSSNPNLDKEIKPLTLSAQERSDLVAFLESLTGELPPQADWPDKK